MERGYRNGLTALELFAGGGLMTIGIETSGFNVIWANDFDERAVLTYAHNFRETEVVLANITELPISLLPDTDIIVGGPPCQDYSVAGTGAGDEGERGKLVWHYLNIIDQKKPKAFLFENVEGLLTKKHINTFYTLVNKFISLGYNIRWEVLNAWDYGVAQKRKRLFIVGIRNDLGLQYEFPQPLEGDYQTQTIRDVIGDLPPPYGIELSEKGYGYLMRDERHLKKHRPPILDEPCLTLPAVLHKGVPYGLFLPDPSGRPRRLTPKECLRIQSVPDWYEFPIGVTTTDQYKMIGNGVPSKVAWYLGKQLEKTLIP